MKLKKHKVYPTMYYIIYDDKTISADFYNITWANEHIRHPLGEIQTLDR